jgi:neutral amino acid transport system permease protein
VITEHLARRRPATRPGGVAALTTAVVALLAALLATLLLGPLLAAPAQAAPADVPAATTDEWGFRGLLRDGAGEPIPDAEVTVLSDGDAVGSGPTDAEGRWGPLAVPEPGTYTLRFDLAGTGETFADGTTVGEVDKEIVDSPTALPVQNVVMTTDEATREVTSTGAQVLQRLVAGLNYGLLLALAAVGLSLVFGTTGLTNFAHGENVTFGALIGYLCSFVLGLPIWLAAVVATLAGAAFGWTQDTGLWGPLRRRRLPLVPLMIVSIGFGLALRTIFQFTYGYGTSAITRETFSTISLGPIRLSTADVGSMLTAVVVLVALGLWLQRSRAGRAIRAVSTNPRLAAASGINVAGTLRLVWTVGGALAGLAGVLLGLFNQVSAVMGFNALLLMFAAVILGGLGTTYGALVGALVVGVFTELLVLWVPSDMKYVGGLVVLVVVLLLRPQGIFGSRERIG